MLKSLGLLSYLWYFCQNLTSPKYASHIEASQRVTKPHLSKLGTYLRELRTQKEQTLHEVSKEADIDSPMLSKIERGDRLPTLDQLRRLSKYYKVSEPSLKTMLTAEKIIREFGANNVTYNALEIVKQRIDSLMPNR
jgi:transcriptional regulator with XRE-family HTH domain